MSLHAIVWAFDQDVFPSSKKFVLVALANFANDKGCAYPSVETLCRLTQQDHKTVRRALAGLVDDKTLSDTGKRAGPTGQVKVYKFPAEAYPKTGIYKEDKTPERLPKDSHKTPERYPNLGTNPVPVNLEPRTNTYPERVSVPVEPLAGEDPNSYLPRIEPVKPPPRTIPFRELQMLINSLMSRHDDDPWKPFDEQLLYEVSIRSKALQEFYEIKAFFDRSNRRYVSQTVRTLLEDWTGNLDKARLPADKPDKPEPESLISKMMRKHTEETARLCEEDL